MTLADLCSRTASFSDRRISWADRGAVTLEWSFTKQTWPTWLFPKVWTHSTLRAMYLSWRLQRLDAMGVDQIRGDVWAGLRSWVDKVFKVWLISTSLTVVDGFKLCPFLFDLTFLCLSCFFLDLFLSFSRF